MKETGTKQPVPPSQRSYPCFVTHEECEVLDQDNHLTISQDKSYVKAAPKTTKASQIKQINRVRLKMGKRVNKVTAANVSTVEEIHYVNVQTLQ